MPPSFPSWTSRVRTPSPAPFSQGFTDSPEMACSEMLQLHYSQCIFQGCDRFFSARIQGTTLLHPERAEIGLSAQSSATVIQPWRNHNLLAHQRADQCSEASAFRETTSGRERN